MIIINRIAISFVLLALACGGTAKKESVRASEDLREIFSSYRAYDHFMKGELYRQSGNYSSAAAEFRKALIFDPESVEIRRALSEVYFLQRKFTEAAVVRSEILERTVEDYNFIGDCLRYGSDFAGAVDFYRRSLELDPSQVMTRTYLASLLQHLGDKKGAEDNYNLVVEYADEKVEAYMELASFYLEIEEYDKALDAYNKALEVEPNDLRPAVGTATIYVSQGDSLKADSVYLSIIEKNRYDAEALSSLLSALFATERIDVAIKASTRIAELLPDDPSAQRRGAYLLFGSGRYAEAESALVYIEERGMADEASYYYMGRIRQFESDFKAAEGYYDKALALNDTLVDAWINLALVMDNQGNYEKALNVMHSAFERIQAESLTLVFYTSIIHSRNERFDLARDGYQRLLESFPENVDFRFNLAAAYERLGEFELAVIEFRWIIEREPQHALALNYLGYMYADRGENLEEALDMIQRAVSLDPENGAFLDSFAWVLYKLGRYKEALEQMEKALIYDDSDPILYDHQGDIFAALNSLEQARESWEKALELDPENEDIRAKLKLK
jgi:tetratricopeptide (TPR) repeat protein